MKRFRIGDEEIEVDVNLAHVLMSISHSHSGSSYLYNRNGTFASIVNNTNQSFNGNTGTNSSSSGSCDGFKIIEHPAAATHIQMSPLSNRMFECKTCNRQFPSFQALGGHRASHKRPKLTPGHCSEVRIEPTKPRVHSCPICGLKFTIGQALGGHMRRHRAISDGVLEQKVEQQENTTSTLCLDLNLAPPGTTSQWRNVSSPIGTQRIVHQVSSMVDCFL